MDWTIVGPVVTILTFGGVLISGIVNKLSSDKIANNHLAHLDIKIDGIAKSQEKMVEKQEEAKKYLDAKLDKSVENQEKIKTDLNGVKVDIAYIKGKNEITDKIVQVLKESK